MSILSGCTRFTVSGFILQSLIHLYLIFVQSYKFEFICILHADIQFVMEHLLKMISFFSGVYFWLLYQKLGAHRYIGFKFRSSIEFYCSICQVFMPIPCCFYHYSFAALLQIWNVKPLLPDLLYCSGLL